MKRGKPLARRTPLKHGGKPLKRTRLKPVSPRRAQPTFDASAAALFKELTCFERVDGRRVMRACIVCGDRQHIEGHHVVPQQVLRREGLDHLLWDPANGVPVCDEPAPNRCHTRHELAVARIPKDRLPEAAVRFAAAIGQSHSIDRLYGAEEGDA